MDITEAREKFLQAWGTLGSSWGVNRTMAQIHALLMIAAGPLSAEEIMEALSISRGNVNMNLRALIDWGLVEKELKQGERKEFFVAEKDIWTIAKQVTIERRKREIAPVLKVLEEVVQVKGAKTEEEKEFQKMTKEIYTFVGKADQMLDKVVRSDKNWFMNKFLKFFT